MALCVDNLDLVPQWVCTYWSWRWFSRVGANILMQLSHRVITLALVGVQELEVDSVKVSMLPILRLVWFEV